MAGFFSYFNDSPANVRNQPGMGGGGLLDIGFYPITMARFIFEAEPVRVMGLLEIDPLRRRPAGLGHPGIPARPRHLHLLHAACAVPESGYPRNARSHRHRDPVEHAHGGPSRLLVDDGSRLAKEDLEEVLVPRLRSVGRAVRPLLRGHRQGPARAHAHRGRRGQHARDRCDFRAQQGDKSSRPRTSGSGANRA
jgi:hypothetical protein